MAYMFMRHSSTPGFLALIHRLSPFSFTVLPAFHGVDGDRKAIYSAILFDGLWLSLARAPRSGRGGRGFESHQPD
jgi:hypothetical protein